MPKESDLQYQFSVIVHMPSENAEEELKKILVEIIKKDTSAANFYNNMVKADPTFKAAPTYNPLSEITEKGKNSTIMYDGEDGRIEVHLLNSNDSVELFLRCFGRIGHKSETDAGSITYPLEHISYDRIDIGNAAEKLGYHDIRVRTEIECGISPI